MRNTLWLLIGLAGIGGALWGTLGDEPQTVAPPSLGRAMLAAQNAVRAQAGITPLAWSDGLAARAQEWANTLVARKQFIHRPQSEFGENLYEIVHEINGGAAGSVAQVVKAWAAESGNYDYTLNKCRGVCGHYTQIVWRDSKEVGCGVGRGEGREVWVCDYDPPGNLVGKRPY